MTTSLFQLLISHGYFAGGALEDWTLVPDPATQALIQRYALVAGMRGGVFELRTFRQDGAGLVRYLHDQMPGAALTFWLCCNEAQFLSVTDLPLDWVGQLDLSSKSRVPDGAGWRIEPALAVRTVQRQGVAGVVSIYPEDLLAMGGQDVRLAVDFTARQVHWLYYLVNRGQTRLDNPAIGRGDFVFAGPEPMRLAGGEKALCFTSGDTAFPLQQRPTIIFDLLDRPAGDSGSAEYCVVKGLPAPAAGNQLEVKYAGPSPYVFCAMHVYL